MNRQEKQQDTPKEQRNHFTFFRSFQEAINQCAEKDQLDLYRGIVSYALDKIEPTFENPLLRLAWTLIKPNLANGWVRSVNGRKSGGIPKPGLIGNRNAKKDEEQSQNKAKTKLNQSNRIGKDRIGIERNKETNAKKDVSLSLTVPASVSDRYKGFLSWLSENCPHLKKMEQPTEEQFFKLLEKSGDSKALQEILLAMENNTDTPKKRRSIYLTASNWLNRYNKK